MGTTLNIRMEKVLILANNMGGLYKFRRELLEALLERGQEVYISVPDGNFRKPLEEMGCRFILTPIDRRGTDPVADLKLMLRYRRLIRSLQPGIVLTYTIKPNIYGGLVCRYMRQPYIANITGMGSAINEGGMFTRFILSLFKMALSGAACVFFQNEMNRSFFVEKGLVGDKHRMIPGSGVNLAEHRLEEYPEGEDLNFLFMGRVMQEKGVDELFAAAETIHSRHPRTTFHILGSCEERYQERLRELEERQIITYHGFQQDVHAYLKACHAVIMPSYHEGMSNVLLEAAATGRPVLASAIPGCQETFEEGVTGLGFAPQDSQALTQVLERFVALPQAARREMGLKGRAKVEQQFDRQQVIASYLQEIDRIS